MSNTHNLFPLFNLPFPFFFLSFFRPFPLWFLSFLSRCVGRTVESIEKYSIIIISYSKAQFSQ